MDEDMNVGDFFGLRESDEGAVIELGPCCICGKDDGTTVNVIMLAIRAPIHGTGWGCIVCGLPSDGALAVICNQCLENEKDISKALKFVVMGRPSSKARISMALMGEAAPFDHDESKHPELQPVMPSAYIQPFNLPYTWRSEASGALSAAVMAYLQYIDHPIPVYVPRPEQMTLLVAYLQYFINAPAWVGPNLETLRQRATTLKTADQVYRWLRQCLAEGIDPL